MGQDAEIVPATSANAVTPIKLPCKNHGVVNDNTNDDASEPGDFPADRSETSRTSISTNRSQNTPKIQHVDLAEADPALLSRYSDNVSFDRSTTSRALSPNSSQFRRSKTTASSKVNQPKVSKSNHPQFKALVAKFQQAGSVAVPFGKKRGDADPCDWLKDCDGSEDSE